MCVQWGHHIWLMKIQLSRKERTIVNVTDPDITLSSDFVRQGDDLDSGSLSGQLSEAQLLSMAASSVVGLF